MKVCGWCAQDATALLPGSNPPQNLIRTAQECVGKIQISISQSRPDARTGNPLPLDLHILEHVHLIPDNLLAQGIATEITADPTDFFWGPPEEQQSVPTAQEIVSKATPVAASAAIEAKEKEVERTKQLVALMHEDDPTYAANLNISSGPEPWVRSASRARCAVSAHATQWRHRAAHRPHPEPRRRW